MDERMAEIGERIRAARRRKKISQTRFGKIVGRSMNGMAMIERGEADPPVGLLMRIAEALEEDFEFLVTGRRKARIIANLSEEELDALTTRLEGRRAAHLEDKREQESQGL
jgi:transcriptional regulator with XRE-family HTH domain